MADDLWRMSALELAAAIKEGVVSALEVVEAHIERIDEVDGDGAVGAIVRRLDGEARAAAERVDSERRQGDDRGPFDGVPFTVKENLDLGGYPTSQGVPVLAAAVAPSDEPAVARLRAAGAIPLARTNMPDMGLRLHTDSGLYGPTRNPWNRDLTPGGSSGGEAAALATGMSPLGIGNDMCGSLRWPSQCCGVSTLKPTVGSIPLRRRPGTPLSVELIAVNGPMARTVADLGAAYGAMAGTHPEDPASVPVLAAPAPLPGPPARTVAVTTDPGTGGTHPDVVAGIERAAAAFEDAGWNVVDAEPPRFEEAARLWPEMVFGTPVPEGTFEPFLSEDAGHVLGLWGMAAGVLPDAAILPGALLRRSEMLREWAAFFEQHGLWLTATGTDQPFEVGADLAGVERVDRILSGHRIIMATNALGLPSITLPVGLAGGLPQSVQLVGPRFSEIGLLDSAEIIERAVEPVTPIDPR